MEIRGTHAERRDPDQAGFLERGHALAGEHHREDRDQRPSCR